MTDQANDAADIAEMTYEQARDELIRVVSELERGAQTLDESITLWERGEALASRCEEWLVGARKRLEAVKRTATADAEDAATEENA